MVILQFIRVLVFLNLTQALHQQCLHDLVEITIMVFSQTSRVLMIEVQSSISQSMVVISLVQEYSRHPLPTSTTSMNLITCDCKVKTQLIQRRYSTYVLLSFNDCRSLQLLVVQIYNSMGLVHHQCVSYLLALQAKIVFQQLFVIYQDLVQYHKCYLV